MPNPGTVINREGAYRNVIETGLRLADAPMSQGGWSEYLSPNDICDLTIEDETLRASTAIMLENTKQWLARKCGVRLIEDNGRQLEVINEATRAAMVGGFSDFLFPIVRASFPTNPINDLVTVQPTTRRTATIVYWDFIVATTKGNYHQGMKLFDAITGKQDSGFNFSSQTVEQEQAASGAGAQTTNGTLTYHDGGGIRPGSISLTATVDAAPATYRDNGNGGWLNSVVGAINYSTGVWSLDVGGGSTLDNGTPVLATYVHANEGSDMLPELDVQITTNTVETERRAMKINYSAEAVQDVAAEFGVNLENNLVTASSEQINFEVARQLLSIMWGQAPVISSFAITPPVNAGYNQQAHFNDLSYHISRASNSIWSRTQKGYGNWMCVDEGGANVFESMGSNFDAAPAPTNPQGLHFLGTYKKKFRVYKDLHLVNLPGASANGNILMGWKGDGIENAGLVYAPYRVLYSTPAVPKASFLTERGMATRYATKLVNPFLFARIDLAV